MAVSEKGELIGVALNGKTCRDNVNKYIDDDNNKECSKFNELKTFFEKADQEVDVFGKYPNVNCIIDLEIVAVDEAYRGRGVCKALIAKTK